MATKRLLRTWDEIRAYPGLIAFVINHNANCGGGLQAEITDKECHVRCRMCEQHYVGVRT